MRRKIPWASDEEQGIDITPMLDIVFIMLIFFIVTTSFTRESGIHVERPQASTSERIKGTNNILVAVGRDGDIWIDKRNVDISSLTANIERLRLQYPDGKVIIQVDKSVQTGLLVGVMDQIRLAGVIDISLATEASGKEKW